MTQRIFDVENEKDMADLWDILPERITKLTPIDNFLYTPDNCIFTNGIIRIDFHDKREITRPLPIQEATAADIGKLCYFWGKTKEDYAYGILTRIGTEQKETYYIIDDDGLAFDHCRRLTKQEIEELI
jgi:hypothetical protein